MIAHFSGGEMSDQDKSSINFKKRFEKAYPHLKEFTAFLMEMNKETDRGAALVAATLIEREVELVWNGKTRDVCNVVLPFQTIEQVDEPRAEKPEDAAAQQDLFSTDSRGRQLKGWTNKLIMTGRKPFTVTGEGRQRCAICTVLTRWIFSGR